jgi:hypothetical protein
MSDRNSTSFAEVRSDNYAARDAGYINLKTIDPMNNSTSELSCNIDGLRTAVKKQRDNQ